MGLACLEAPLAAEKPQDFLDESGRLLYSIDAQGVVSMYETDALDNQLSVTRGTRESMKPRITEVFPPSIEPGKMTVVTFKGANLVGAKFSSSTRGIKFGGSAPRATTVGVPIEVDPSVKPGPVTISLTTPIGSVTTTFTVTQRGGSLAARAEKNEPEFKAPSPGKPETCPEGMVSIGSATGGFCIDIKKTVEGDWFEVEKDCSFKFKRLCWAEEWELACKEDQKSSLGLKNMLGGWEWTRTSVYVAPGEQAGGKGAADNEDWLAIIRGKESCTSSDKKDPGGGGTRPGRCCK